MRRIWKKLIPLLGSVESLGAVVHCEGVAFGEHPVLDHKSTREEPKNMKLAALRTLRNPFGKLCHNVLLMI
jgi:hypothetical protein